MDMTTDRKISCNTQYQQLFFCVRLVGVAGERLNASKLTNPNNLKTNKKYVNCSGMKEGELNKQDFNNKLRLNPWTINQAKGGSKSLAWGPSLPMMPYAARKRKGFQESRIPTQPYMLWDI